MRLMVHRLKLEVFLLQIVVLEKLLVVQVLILLEFPIKETIHIICKLKWIVLYNIPYLIFSQHKPSNFLSIDMGMLNKSIAHNIMVV